MRRGVRALARAALLVALATALVRAPALAAEAGEGIDGGAKPFANVSLARESFRDGGSPFEGSPFGRGTLRKGAPVSMPFRLAIPQPRPRNERRATPGVSFQANRRYSLFLLKLSLFDPQVNGAAALAGGGLPDPGSAGLNRIAEMRSRTVVKYNVSNRIFFVGQAHGSRLRMLRLTLARYFGGIEVGAHPPGDRFMPLSETEAALLRARDLTVRRALAPRLTFPGLSLNLGGISIQAGVRVRVF